MAIFWHVTSYFS